MDLLPTDQVNMFAGAESYERFMGRWSRRIAPLLVEFADLGAASRVLDLGCGTGALAAEVAARGPALSAVGIDLSPAYVAYAQAVVRGRRVSFEVGDAQRLRFTRGEFDAALSLLALNFIPAPHQALAELRRVVRPTGVIAAAVWDYGDGMQMLRAFWDTAVALDPAAAERDEKHMPLCRAGELKALWLAGGLTDVAECSLESPAHFESFDDYWAPFLLGQGPAGAYVASLPAEKVARLRSETARRLPRAPFTLCARVWAVRGVN